MGTVRDPAGGDYPDGDVPDQGDDSPGDGDDPPGGGDDSPGGDDDAPGGGGDSPGGGDAPGGDGDVPDDGYLPNGGDDAPGGGDYPDGDRPDDGDLPDEGDDPPGGARARRARLHRDGPHRDGRDRDDGPDHDDSPDHDGHADRPDHDDYRDGVDLIQEAWLRERPGTPVGSIGVVTRIWRLARLLQDDRARTMARLGVDVATRDLLATLRRAGPPYRMSAGELASAAMVSPGAISQRVARAEAAGLVRRERPEGDQRRVVVELTTEGHALVERTVDGLLRHEEGLLSALDDEQREQLAGLLRILLADLTRRSGGTERAADADA